MTHCSLYYLDENGGGAKYRPCISGVKVQCTASAPCLIYAAAKSMSSFSAEVSRGFLPLMIEVMILNSYKTSIPSLSKLIHHYNCGHCG